MHSESDNRKDETLRFAQVGTTNGGGNMRNLAVCLYVTVVAGACVAQDDKSDSDAIAEMKTTASFAEQPQLIIDPTTVTISPTNTGVAFDPPSLTVLADHETIDVHTTDVSGALIVPPGMFTTSGTFALGFNGIKQLTLASNPSRRSIVVTFTPSSPASANGTITVGTGNGPNRR